MTVTPYIQDTDLTLYQGDVLEVLRTLPAESVHCVVTSPPYWGLRDYGTGSWDGGDPDCDHKRPFSEATLQSSGLNMAKNRDEAQSNVGSRFGNNAYKESCGKCGARRVDSQLGLEATPEQYLSSMVAVFREVRRVLRRDGSCWVNIGDSYAAQGQNRSGDYLERTGGNTGLNSGNARTHEYAALPAGLKPKDLCMIPARLALALQADGWWLRSQIVWSKPNPMPESVTDRPTTSHEFVYLLTKSPRYFFDQEAVREPHQRLWDERNGGSWNHMDDFPEGSSQRSSAKRSESYPLPNPAGRNLRSVWEIPTQPYPEAHFATYPEELVRRCILAGSSERGCCPECGAPWTRTTESKTEPARERWAADNSVKRNDKERAGGFYPVRTTSEWEPSCGHYETLLDRKARYGVEACTVLDPFFGSGTTALVARKHGRRTIGIELNPEYCELAARRLQQLSLLA